MLSVCLFLFFVVLAVSVVLPSDYENNFPCNSSVFCVVLVQSVFFNYAFVLAFSLCCFASCFSMQLECLCACVVLFLLRTQD